MPTRNRAGALIAAALSLSLFLTACGSSSGAASEATSGQATAERAAAQTFPVTVDHKFGTTVIEAEPQRVVSVGFTEHDTLLALGVTPVGVTDWYGDQPYATWPWARDELGDATPEVLSLADGFQFERIAALQPDVIIGTNAGMTEEDYAKLSAIAPTVAQSGDYTDYFEPWYVQSLSIGTAVGKQTQVTDLVAQVRQQFADAAAAHPEFAGVPAVFLQNAIYDGSAIAYQKGLSTDSLTDLGFEIPAQLDTFATEGGQAYVPVEQLTVLDSADVLIWGTEQDTDRAELENVPLFTSLAAVKNDASIYTGGELAAAIYFTTPLSLPFVLDTHGAEARRGAVNVEPSVAERPVGRQRPTPVEYAVAENQHIDPTGFAGRANPEESQRSAGPGRSPGVGAASDRVGRPRREPVPPTHRRSASRRRGRRLGHPATARRRSSSPAPCPAAGH